MTESPHTIDPGRLLVEVDGVRLSYDRADPAGNTHTGVAVPSTIGSSGVTRDFDVQVGAELFLRETFDADGRKSSRSGIGDLAFQMKWTLWRDDARRAALAVIPYVRLPTITGAVGADHVEGGFIVPWVLTLGSAVMAGAMFNGIIVATSRTTATTHTGSRRAIWSGR